MLIRSGILIVVITTIAATSWFFITKDKIKPVPSPSPTASVETTPVSTPEITPPASLILLTKTKNLSIETYAELQNTFFDNILQPVDGQEEFSRILIKNTTKNQFLGLKEFFEAFGVAAPADFYDKVDNDFTLFTYASSGEARLGFIIKVNNKEGLADLMKSWEPTMQNDFSQLFAKGLKKPLAALSPVFRNAFFKTHLFRYQTFATNDFGICYGIMSKLAAPEGSTTKINDYLVFTTSGKSMLKIIDLIQNQI